MDNTRKPVGGRKPSKPEYSAERNLAQQMEAAADLYTDKMSLQAIADALALNPIKVRKLLITARIYESDTAKLVRQTFNTFRETQNYSTAVTSTMAALRLSRPSVTSYLPYEKGVYFPEEAEAANISAGAERQRHYRAVVATMLDKAFEKIPDGTGLILHSDQGWQYQHKQYQQMLREKGVRQSMSRKGNCLDNAVIENFFGLLKSELLYLQEFRSMEHFKLELIEYLDYYNNRRIKAKLKGLPPAIHRQQALSAA